MDTGSSFDPLEDANRKGFPWVPVIVGVLFVVFGILAFWITREKKTQSARAAVLSVLDQELTRDESGIKAQREKVVDLTQRLEEMRVRIQTGNVANGKAAVKEYNRLAAEQRAERDKFSKMADEYNKKVAKYRALED